MIRIIRLIFLISSIFFTSMSVLMFFLKHKIGLWSWLMINTCAASVVVFICGALTNNKIVLGAAFCLMLFYGMLGLLIFSWRGKRIYPQIAHFLMVTTCAYILLEIIISGDLTSFVLGVLLGIIILIPFFIYQTRYFRTHPEIIKKLKDQKFVKIVLG